MTGVLNAMVGAASVERISITIADLGANDYGTSSISVSLRGNNLFFVLSTNPDRRRDARYVSGIHISERNLHANRRDHRAMGVVSCSCVERRRYRRN
jgi:hypothetical protein